MDRLLHMQRSLKEAMQVAEHQIEERQRAIQTQLKSVQQERKHMGVERRQFEDEQQSIAQQQTDLDVKLAEMSHLRMELGTGAGRLCCQPAQKLNELDFTGDLTLARAPAVEVNGIYFRVVEDGELHFRKQEDGKAIYFQDGFAYGLSNAWYVGDCYRGTGVYWCKSVDENTIPFAGWEVFDNEDFGNPGSYPPPILEIAQ
mmetsp:Transcript_38938/g.111860  ORF Transcript_38938/g.111860 Transcript_38938/m.111860 type:complete len:201 (+) Transcript_38938:59-661(+)